MAPTHRLTRVLVLVALTGPYTQMDGDACLFGSGQNMQSRVYFACGEKATSEVILESYYECKVHVKVTDPRLCTRPTPPTRPPTTPSGPQVTRTPCNALAVCWPCASRVLAVCWPCAGRVLAVC